MLLGNLLFLVLIFIKGKTPLRRALKTRAHLLHLFPGDPLFDVC
jgi:hypothetical protein